MSEEDRQSYFRRRARDARDLAAKATDERVRLVHTEMAIRYEQQARGDGTGANGQFGPIEIDE